MTQTKNNIDSRKRKHFSYAERCQIAVLKKEKYTNRQIADVLNQAPRTINNEIKRGTITQLNHQEKNEKNYDYYTSVYDADAGQTFYEKQRMNCGRRPNWADRDSFIEWADDKMLTENGLQMLSLALLQNKSCLTYLFFHVRRLFINGLIEELCEQRTLICLKNYLEKQKEQNTVIIQTNEYWVRPLKNTLRQSIQEKPSATGKLTRL